MALIEKAETGKVRLQRVADLEATVYCPGVMCAYGEDTC